MQDDYKNMKPLSFLSSNMTVTLHRSSAKPVISFITRSLLPVRLFRAFSLLLAIQIYVAAPAAATPFTGFYRSSATSARPGGLANNGHQVTGPGAKDSSAPAAVTAPSYALIPKPVAMTQGASDVFFDLGQRGTDTSKDHLAVTIEVPEDWLGTAELLAGSWHLPASAIRTTSLRTADAGRHAGPRSRSRSGRPALHHLTHHHPSNITDTVPDHKRQVVFQKVSSQQLQQIMAAATTAATGGSPASNQQHIQAHILEAYTLKVTPDEIIIQAADAKGAICGMFTLLQLQKLQWNSHQIPCVQMYDYPRYDYRGLMLDVSRNFFPPMYIKKLLDLMALYKINTFHWHLTDGAGWRLEIKKYPLLTAGAAFRPQGPQTAWSANGRRYASEGAPDSYGGYYSQAEARDIVAYAAKRGINIIPEIEFPGHAEELLHAYPFLSATGSAKGVHEINVCSDSTYAFMENVLTEVMAIFPSTYIHIGGDEASKKSWQDCSQCKELMQKNGLKDLNGLQSYGIHRLERFLNQHGRQLLGWDEITQGGLAPGAAVMVWRNPHTAIQVAREGHKVIQATSKYLYLDHYQSDPMTEPEAIGGYIPLSKVYAFNPLPEDSLTIQQQPNMLGVQANLFTEWVPTMEHADYMLFPRVLALSEIAWTPHGQQDYNDFLKRMQQQYLLLQRAHVNYCRPRPVVIADQKVDRPNQQILVTLSSELYQPKIYYTTNGDDPVISGQLYTAPFAVKGHALVKAVILPDGALTAATKNDQAAILVDSFAVDYHPAIGKKGIYKAPVAKSYPAGGSGTLTDGITGSLTYSDDRWQGFLGKQLDVTVDMDRMTDLHSLDIRFMQLTGPGVYMPREVSIAISSDNQHFTQVGTVATTTPASQTRLRFENYHFDLAGKNARYIRVVAPHDRGFLFTDEIKIY